MSDVSKQMFPVINRELFDAVVSLNAGNGVRASELKSILQDLIAELRQSEDHSDYSLVQMSCMRAELRMKEVTGDE